VAEWRPIDRRDRVSDAAQPLGSPDVFPARPRPDLSEVRTQLALDRTTLAWIRTSLTLGTFGFGMVGFFRSLRAQAPTAETVRLHQGAIQFGTGLVVLGISFMALAGLSHWFTLRKLRTGEPLGLARWPLALALAFLLAILFLAGLWALRAR
jgi:putative membrane protein